MPGMNRRPHLSIVAPDATPEEAASVVAALEQFMRATAPVRTPPAAQPSTWKRTALKEGVMRADAHREAWT